MVDDTGDRSWTEVGTNVEYDTDDDYLYVRVPLSETVKNDAQISDSGKSHILASTKGFIKVDNQVSFGMNVLLKRPGFEYKKGK